MSETKIAIASDFSRFPAGRYATDGPFSGEAFRERKLVPLLKEGHVIIVALDGTLGYGSSFLEEAFGGLVRNHAFTLGRLKELLRIQTADASLEKEVWLYIQEADEVRSKA